MIEVPDEYLDEEDLFIAYVLAAYWKIQDNKERNHGTA